MKRATTTGEAQVEGNGSRTGGPVGENGPAVPPPSRAREIASRGHPPSPELMFQLCFAAGIDAIKGAVATTQANSMCGAFRTSIYAAKNADALGAMCDRIEMAEKERTANEEAEREAAKKRRLAELRAEVEALESGAPA